MSPAALAPDPTEALRAAQRPLTRCLWTPADAITFTPHVLSKVYGDGRALFGLTTINNRPAYWIVRGCSTWEVSDYNAPDDASEFYDFVDDIVSEIEAEFGGVSCYERNCRGEWIDSETKRFIPRSWVEYPTIDDETGCSWFRLDWPPIDGLAYQPHPFARGYNVLATPLNDGEGLS